MRLQNSHRAILNIFSDLALKRMVESLLNRSSSSVFLFSRTNDQTVTKWKQNLEELDLLRELNSSEVRTGGIQHVFEGEKLS